MCELLYTIFTINSTILVISLVSNVKVNFQCFSDFLGRLQPSKTTIQKTPGTLGVEESGSPWKVLQFYTSNQLKNLSILSRGHLIANSSLNKVLIKKVENKKSDFKDLSGETSNLKNYYFWEASKYNFSSTCSTHGYYMLTNMCILKPPKSSSFWGLKSLQRNLENLEKSTS